MSTDHPRAHPASTSDADDPIWTAERIRQLGTVTDLKTAASIFQLSRAVAYELARTDQFPVPVIRAGARYRVPVAPILAVLRLQQPDSAATT